MTEFTGVKLDDPSLFREQCYVDGEWIAAASGRVIEVNNPATNESIGSVPALEAE